MKLMILINKKQLTLDNSSKLQASLIVASDGIDSPSAKAFGIKRKQAGNINNVGLVCAVEHEHSSDNTAYQYFLPEGPTSYFAIKKIIPPQLSGLKMSKMHL
ncbi:MAG: hypothetical protein ACJ0DF_12325 [Paracoccaceae bacterium]